MNRSFSISLCSSAERIARRTLPGSKKRKRIIASANRRKSLFHRIIATRKRDRKTRTIDVFISVCEIHFAFETVSYLRNTPPRRLAFKHSGGDSRLCTSATVTLYLLVLLSNDNRPGTEQNTSDGCAFPDNIVFSLLSEGFISAKLKI